MKIERGDFRRRKKYMDPMALVDKKFSQVKSAVKYIYLGFLSVTRRHLIEDTHREASKRAPTVSASRVRASRSLAAVDRERRFF